MKKAIEKLVYSFFVTILLVANISYGQREYFRYLPDDSRIKLRCEQAGDKGLFFKNRTQNACDYIHNVLRAIAEDEQKTINSTGPFGGGMELLTLHVTLHGNDKRMKDAIRTILEDETDEVKWEEFDKVCNAASEVKKDRVKQEELQKQEEAACKKYEKKHPKF